MCKLDLSNQVIELEDLNLLNKTDGQDLVSEGFYIVVDDENDYFPPRDKGAIIINIKDLINSNYYHSDEGRLNGCCGYDGCDGMNRVCLCGHEIGTERSDCWISHFIALNPESVQFV